MWFRLASAEWETGKHLGAMNVLANAWSVGYNVSGGITKTSGSGSVSKGGTLTATFTLSTGATFTSATLTPSTAGTVTSTTSGSTVTITIANVSANCTLSVVATGGSVEPETPVTPPSSEDIADLVNAYSTSMTSTQQSALSTYVNTVKSNPALASKIKKMYMPILSTTLDDVRINVADYINNNTATVDTFAGTWNDSIYGFKNNGIYNTTASTNVYTTTGVAGMSSMKMNNLGLISVFNITAGSTNGTRLTSTGGGCFFLRNYSAGNAAVQGTANGQTGTYCGKDLSELYSVPAGYFQNKTTTPCIDMLMFSENQFLGLEGTDGQVQTYSLASAHTDTINVNMQDTCYFSYMIPTSKANTDYGTVGYMILITEALTANEMVVLRDAINTFVDAYLA